MNQENTLLKGENNYAGKEMISNILYSKNYNFQWNKMKAKFLYPLLNKGGLDYKEKLSLIIYLKLIIIIKKTQTKIMLFTAMTHFNF